MLTKQYDSQQNINRTAHAPRMQQPTQLRQLALCIRTACGIRHLGVMMQNAQFPLVLRRKAPFFSTGGWSGGLGVVVSRGWLLNKKLLYSRCVWACTAGRSSSIIWCDRRAVLADILGGGFRFRPFEIRLPILEFYLVFFGSAPGSIIIYLFGVYGLP